MDFRQLQASDPPHQAGMVEDFYLHQQNKTGGRKPKINSSALLERRKI